MNVRKRANQSISMDYFFFSINNRLLVPSQGVGGHGYISRNIDFPTLFLRFYIQLRATRFHET